MPKIVKTCGSCNHGSEGNDFKYGWEKPCCICINAGGDHLNWEEIPKDISTAKDELTVWYKEFPYLRQYIKEVMKTK